MYSSGWKDPLHLMDGFARFLRRAPSVLLISAAWGVCLHHETPRLPIPSLAFHYYPAIVLVRQPAQEQSLRLQFTISSRVKNKAADGLGIWKGWRRTDWYS